MRSVKTLLDRHVTFSVEFVDRLQKNGYVPMRKPSHQVVRSLCGYRGKRIPSPALLGHMTDDFVRRVKAYAADHDIPIVEFERGRRKSPRRWPGPAPASRRISTRSYDSPILPALGSCLIRTCRTQ